MTRLFNKLNTEMTPLVAYGLIAISAILAFTLLGNLADAVDIKRSDLEASKSELATLAQLQGDDVWTERLAKSEAAKQQVTDQIWRGTTPGVISADLEQTLRQLASSITVGNTIINIDQEPEMVGDVEVMHFDIRARTDKSVDAVDFISRLTQDTRQIIIKDANLSLPESQQASIVLSGYVPIQTVTTTAENTVTPESTQ